jgi:hypothetical protein
MIYTKPPKTDRTVKEIWETFSVYEKNLTYELVGQVLENGDYNREALVMFDDEKLEVVKTLIDQAFVGK